MSPYDRWLTTEPVTLHNGRPTDCDRCQSTRFSWHPFPRKNAHYRCTNCNAHYYINEVE